MPSKKRASSKNRVGSAGEQRPDRNAGAGRSTYDSGRRRSSLWRGIESEVEEGHIEELDPATWQRALDHKRQMARFTVGTYDPGLGHLRKLPKGQVGVFLTRRGETAAVVGCENPNPRGSFGFVGTFARLTAKSAHLPGTLVLPFNPRRLGTVARTTLRVFEWEARTESYCLVRDSGVGEREDYVWAHVAGPGLFAVIGLNIDPRILATIHAFAALPGYLRAAGAELRDSLQQRLCELVLCNPEWDAALADQGLVERLGQNGVYDWPPDSGFPPRGDEGCVQCKELYLPDGGLPDGGLLPPDRRRPFEYHWTSLGPTNLSGCIVQVVIDVAERHRLYAAAADGGLWVLDDVCAYPQQNWRPLTDDNANLVTQAVAVAASNNQILYIADGATHILRSADRGQTWGQPSDQWFDTVRCIAVDPQNADIVYIAARNGCWRSTSGGVPRDGIPGWIRVHDGEVTDIVLDPDDSHVVYLGEKLPNQPVNMHTMRLFRSPNRGVDWRLLHELTVPVGAPSIMVKVALGRSGDSLHRAVGVKFGTEVWINRQGPGSPRTVFERPFLPKGKPGNERSDHNNGQGDWSHTFAIDPFDDRVMLVGGQDYYRSTDGGDTWAPVQSFHEDQQSIAFDVAERGRVYVSHDGGVCVSTNGGATFRPGDTPDAPAHNLGAGLVTMQFFHAGLAGARMVADAYHWGTLATEQVSGRSWERIEGGGWEFADVYGDLHRPYFFYVFGDELRRRRVPAVASEVPFYPIAKHPSQIGGISPTAIAVDPRRDSTTLLLGAIVTVSATEKRARVLRTDDATFEHVVQDGNGQWGLDPPMAWREQPGVDLPPDDRIVAIAFAPSRDAMAYAASAQGKLFVYQDIDDAQGWVLAGEAPHGVRALAINPGDVNRIYALGADHVMRSNDGGVTGSWEEIHGSGATALPNTEYHTLLMRRFDRLFLGAHAGVFMSPDEGESWYPIDDNGLPNVPVQQLLYSDGGLYALTLGRGVWRSDTDT